MRTAIKDIQLEEIICRDGCVVINLLDQNKMLEVGKQIRELGFGLNHENKLRISITHESEEIKKDIFKRLSPVFQQAIDSHLSDYKVIRVGIFDKLPGGDEIRVHQHPNLVEEPDYRSLTIWLPLIDTTVKMGTLHVVKGSHNIFNHIRSYNDHCAFSSVSMRIIKKFSTPLPLKAGQAVIFDERLIHWSPPNKSTITRTALQLMTIPKESRIEVHYRENEQELLKYAVSEETYREATLVLKKPGNLELIGRIKEPRISYDNKQFIHHMQAGYPESSNKNGSILKRLFN